MAFELVEEVLDHAPAVLDAAEVLLLSVIAEQIRRGRTVDISQDVFLRRLRVTESGLRKVFKRLVSHGIDVRVPLRHTPDGKPVYAMIGRTCTFRLPNFPAPKECSCHRCKEAVPQALLRKEEGPQGSDSGLQGADSALQGAGLGPQDPPPVPSVRYGGGRGHASPLAGEPLSAKDAQESIRSALEKSTMRTRPLNGRSRAGAFEALLEYPVDTDAGGKPDATPPEL